MTSRERLLTAIHLGTPDRIPVAPFELGKLDPDGEMAAELIAKTDPFICVGGDSNPFIGKGIPVETRWEGDTVVTVIHTPRGDLTRRHRYTDVTSATIEFPFKTTEDVEKYLSLSYTPPDVDVTEFGKWQRRVGEEALVMVGICDAVCLPASWFSPEGFCLAWADDPDLVIRLTEVAAERVNIYVERLCQTGIDAFRIIGGEYASVQLGHEAFSVLVRKPDTTLVEIIHQYGGIAYFHNHGRVTDYYEALASIGIDALDPLEAPPWGDADLAEAKRRIGDRVCLVGNLDDMEVVESLDVETVKEMARRCIEAAGPDGYILGGTASGIYTERGARNFIALVDVAEEMR